jgi:spore coat polysaccharide biosynthesis protein SpsF (cytidylyltransferase family)
MKILIGLQARSKSKRLPGKIYQKLGSKSILQMGYEACKLAEAQIIKNGIEAVTAILGPKGDQELEDYTTTNLMRAVFPSCDDHDLMSRYEIAADMLGCTHIIRLTSDCPFIEPNLVIIAAERLKEDDYVSNTGFRTYAEGLDVQAISLKAHRWLHKLEDLEHPYLNLDMNASLRAKFAEAGFRYGQIMNPEMSFLLKCLSVDTEEDLKRVREIHGHYEKKKSALV